MESIVNNLISAMNPESFDANLISDGYHTFGELYDFRKLYNAVLFNEWAAQGKYKVHKSLRHSDGKRLADDFGGEWFIVVAELPAGQISNHYKIEDWDLFQCEVEYKALLPYDGHTAQDVLQRLEALTLDQKRGWEAREYY